MGVQSCFLRHCGGQSARYGSDGIWAVVALGVAWFLWTVGRQNFDPSHERHLIVMQAEDLNRLRHS